MRIKKPKYFYKNVRVSKGELLICNYLEKNNILFEREFSFDDLRSDKGCLLRFDFFISKYNLLIEFQGQHHFKPVNKYQRAKKVHDQTLYHDKLKKDYVLKNNITFLEITYKQYEQIDTILDYSFSYLDNLISNNHLSTPPLTEKLIL